MNTSALWPDPDTAELRVRRMQRKLHHWAVDESDRCFDDLYNLVYDPAFLTLAWERVRTNKGARSAGADGTAPRSVGAAEAVGLLQRLREELKERIFRPDPVREVMIPKANGKLRRLGIATVADRVVQASLKLVLEPIFEADFHPCAYGFRPGRRAQDAIAEIHHLASGSRAYHWVFEGDITACFDEISHSALMGRVRRRVGDKRVLALVKSFLKAGILSKDLGYRDTITGTPQGGILSPLLSNVALSVLDEHFAAKWKALGPEWTRAKHRRAGVPTMKIVRYADISVSWSTALALMPKRFGTRSQQCSRRWACACRSRRAGSATSTRGSSSSASASNGRSKGARPSTTSTPGRRRRHLCPSPTKSGI